MATPFFGEPCACHELDGDGIDDLSLKFSAYQVTRAFQLNELSPGATIKLVLRGTMQDGTTFEAFDCIVIPGETPVRKRLPRPRRTE